VDIARDKYYYNGVEIKFVPLPENCIVAALPSNLVWCTRYIGNRESTGRSGRTT